VWSGNLLGLLSFIPVIATWFFLTLYLQEARDRTPLQTGLLLWVIAPATIAMAGGGTATETDNGGSST
jgi:hypothetical protein